MIRVEALVQGVEECSVSECEIERAKSPLARVRTAISHFAFTTFTENRVIACDIVFCDYFSDNF